MRAAAESLGLIRVSCVMAVPFASRIKVVLDLRMGLGAGLTDSAQLGCWAEAGNWRGISSLALFL